MNRHTSATANTLTYHLWLVFDAEGSVRLNRGRPGMGVGERGLALALTVPKSIFKTPELVATITIPETDSRDAAIDLTAAREALSLVMGVDVVLKVKGPDE